MVCRRVGPSRRSPGGSEPIADAVAVANRRHRGGRRSVRPGLAATPGGAVVPARPRGRVVAPAFRGVGSDRGDSVECALEGDTLLNNDIRADNILLTSESTLFVDWPHALVGPPWLDVVGFAPSVTMQGGPLPEEVISRHSACRTANSEAITAAVVALAGYFTHQAVQPPPSGLPTVRAFQDAQGVVAREWIAHRTGLS